MTGGYPPVVDPAKVGEYPAVVKVGGGLVWDAVLEYRVWCHEEPEPGEYVHRKEERLTEWPVEFLKRPKRTATTIPDFLSPNAPANRLDIIRGVAKAPT